MLIKGNPPILVLATDALDLTLSTFDSSEVRLLIPSLLHDVTLEEKNILVSDLR